MIAKIVEIVKLGLQHSTALAFLIFSGIFVIFSIKYGIEKYILIAFFTFFYTFIAYRIRVISKKEVWGDYAVGDNFGALLYFLIDWLFFAGWILGVVFLLTGISSFLLWTKITFGGALIFFTVWMGKIFYTKVRHERIKCEQRNEAKCYEVECCCKNCDLNRKVKIPKKIRVENLPCPECEVGGVLRKKGGCKNSNEI